MAINNRDWIAEQISKGFSQKELKLLKPLFEKLDRALYKTWAKQITLTELSEIVELIPVIERKVTAKTFQGPLPSLRLSFSHLPKGKHLYEDMEISIEIAIRDYMEKTGMLPKKNQILKAKDWGDFGIASVKYNEAINYAEITVRNQSNPQLP